MHEQKPTNDHATPKRNRFLITKKKKKLMHNKIKNNEKQTYLVLEHENSLQLSRLENENVFQLTRRETENSFLVF